jgi:hypothetical protein
MSQKKPLPFEPQPFKAKKKPVPVPQSSAPSRSAMGIPPIVNRRLVRRAALFCGIPTALGILTFIVSYVVVSRHLVELPNTAVVLVSMLFFGIGVLGLSYGAISASWDEDRVGSWWGWQEFQKNCGVLQEAWQTQRAKTQTPKDP